MTILAIDHVNIRTTRVQATARFFADVLDMAITPSPATDDPDRGLWVCDVEGRAAVHIAHPGQLYPWEVGGCVPAEEPAGSSRIHHVAFRCDDHAALIARLSRLGIAYDCNTIPAIGLRQIFVRESNDILLELNFFAPA